MNEKKIYELNWIFDYFIRKPQLGTRVSKQLRPSNSRANLGFINEFLDFGSSSFLLGSGFGTAGEALLLLGVKEGTEEEALTKLPRRNSAAKASNKLNMEFILVMLKLLNWERLLVRKLMQNWGEWEREFIGRKDLFVSVLDS